METKDIPPIYFYLPAHRRPPAPIPEEVPRGYVDNMSDAFFCNTSLNWTLQTYLRLREHDYPCELVDTIPDEGIVVGFRGDLPIFEEPSGRSFLVALMGDADWHPYAQVHIRQNPRACQCQLDGVENTFFMHHWTQPGLVPRDPSRENTFENVGYFGHPSQLAAPLRSREWEDFLSGCGLNWMPVYPDSDRRSDYSDIDLIVAVRSFDGRSYDYKPATKLHNAWRAGVPAILGPESAYQQERTDEKDYLEAQTYDDIRRHVKRLCESPELREQIRKRSKSRGCRIKPAYKVEKWWDLLTGPVREKYEQWQSQNWVRQQRFYARRWLRIKRTALSERLDW